MIVFLLIVIAAIILGIIGVAVHGLIWLLIIGIVVFVADLVYGVIRFRRRGNRRGRHVA
ncbi:hypothetical protein ACFWN1_16680 [Streptomyces sp. NPDC058459]|uniref:hypothetical protein n=1 Tax=Streptomyces sp. NPDC058459 TaxID=3346508 RepID=UPI003654FA7C